MKHLLSLLVAILLLSPLASRAETDGPGYLAELLQDALSSAGRDVRISGFEGALSSKATIEELTVADDDGIWFTARGVTLDWNRAALLRARLDVNLFEARQIIVSRKPRSTGSGVQAEATPFQVPDLPVGVTIARISAPDVQLGSEIIGQPVTLSIDGSATLGDGGFDLKAALHRTDGKHGAFDLSAGFDPATRIAAVDIKASEAAKGIIAALSGNETAPALGLALAGRAPIDDFTARLQLAADGRDAASGTIRLVAPEGEGRWSLATDLTGDFSAIVSPAASQVLGNDAAFSARIERDGEGRTHVTGLSVEAAALTLTGEAIVGPDGWPSRVDVRGNLASVDGAAVALPFAPAGTTVHQGAITLRFDQSEDNTLVFDAVLDGLETTAASIPRLKLGARGTLDVPNTDVGKLALDLTFDARAIRFSDPGLAQALGDTVTGAFRLAHSSGGPWQVSDLSITARDLALTGSAVVQPNGENPVSVDTTLELGALGNFESLVGHELGGAAMVTLRGDITPLSGGFDLALDGETRGLALNDARLDPMLAGTDTISARIKRDETGLAVRDVTVQTPVLRADGFGKVTTPETTAQLNATLTDAGLLAPGLLKGPGRFRTHVVLRDRGTSNAELSFDVSGAVQGSGAPNEPFGIAGLSGKAELSILGNAPGKWHVEARAKDLSTSKANAESVGFTAQGTVELDDAGGLSRMDGSFETEAGRMAVAVSSGMALETPLAASGKIDWADGALSLSSVEIQSDLAQVTGRATISNLFVTPLADVAARVSLPDMAEFSALAGVPLEGSADIDLTLNHDGTQGQVAFSGVAQNVGIGNDAIDQILQGDTQVGGRVLLAERKMRFEDMRLRNDRIDVQADGDLSRVAFDATLGDPGVLVPGLSGPLRADGTLSLASGSPVVDVMVSAPGQTRAQVTGKVSSDASDLTISGRVPLALVNGLIAPRRVDGFAAIDLRLVGAPDVNNLSGTVTPQDAQVTLPTAGIALQPVTGRIKLANGRADVDLSGNGQKGGALRVTGNIGLLAPYRTDLAPTFQSLGFSDPALYEGSVDGGLTVTGDMVRGLTATGRLTLGRTEIRVPSSGVTATGSIPDIAHVGAPGPVVETLNRAGLNAKDRASGSGGPPVGLDIKIKAPGQLFVRGRGLDAELGGVVYLKGSSLDLVPAGGFELIRGRLDLLGHRFVLTEGQVQLLGDFDPVLRFVASTEANGVQVDVTLAGSASSPEVTFSSSPDLPQDEILAELIFGRDVSSLSAFQALELANAVATLAGRGGTGIVGKLRDSFRLDDLDVTQTETGGTQVRAGKYISDNVYSDIAVDSAGTSEINLNLDISPNVTARGGATSSGDSSIGIFFEKNY